MDSAPMPTRALHPSPPPGPRRSPAWSGGSPAPGWSCGSWCPVGTELGSHNRNPRGSPQPGTPGKALGRVGESPITPPGDLPAGHHPCGHVTPRDPPTHHQLLSIRGGHPPGDGGGSGGGQLCQRSVQPLLRHLLGAAGAQHHAGLLPPRRDGVIPPPSTQGPPAMLCSPPPGMDLQPPQGILAPFPCTRSPASDVGPDPDVGAGSRYRGQIQMWEPDPDIGPSWISGGCDMGAGGVGGVGGGARIPLSKGRIRPGRAGSPTTTQARRPRLGTGNGSV